MALPPLLTLAEYKSFLGITSTGDDTQITANLTAASRAVRSYTDRKFEIASGPATQRTFEYDLSGFLDIDDCTGITLVTTDAGVAGQTYTLDSSEYSAMPNRETSDDDPYYYLRIHGGRWFPASPAMGFERNLDTIGYFAKYPTITVTATWGWPAVPDDVKLATAWTIEEVINEAETDDLRSEAIAGYARTWDRGSGNPTSMGLPRRSRDYLDNYVRAY